MPELIRPDGSPISHDDNGVKVTMPFVVTITTQWLIEARTKEQAVAGVHRGTSYSAVLIPAMLGTMAEAGVAPPEVMVEFNKMRKA